MALDAAVGGSTSNSYVTVTEADAYFANRSHAELWTDLTDNAVKENLLITSSLMLDAYLKWKGVRYTAEQAMDWPRNDVYDDRGVLFAIDIIPQPVKMAVYEQTLSSIETDRTADGDLEGIAEARAGSLMVKTDEGVFNSAPDTIPDKVRQILSGLIAKSGIAVVRLIRA